MNLADLDPPQNERQQSGNKFFQFSIGGEKMKMIGSCMILYSLLAINGYFQELIFAYPGFRPYEWNLLLFQFLHCFLFGWIEMLCRRAQRSSTCLSIYAMFGSLVLCHYAFSTHAIIYLNHPVYLAFECLEMFAVMFGGIYFLKKRYNFIEYVSTVFICIGLVAFALTNTHMAPEFHILGIVLMCLAISCDAILFNYQEKLTMGNRVSGAEIIFCTYLFSFVYLTSILVVTANFWEGISFCFQRNFLCLYIMLYCLTGYTVLRLLLFFIRAYNAFNTILIVSCYKAVAVMVSIIRFEQSLTIAYVWPGVLLVMGIYMCYRGQKISSNQELKERIERAQMAIALFNYKTPAMQI